MQTAMTRRTFGTPHRHSLLGSAIALAHVAGAQSAAQVGIETKPDFGVNPGMTLDTATKAEATLMAPAYHETGGITKLLGKDGFAHVARTDVNDAGEDRVTVDKNLLAARSLDMARGGRTQANARRC